jgi:hypothetical protein
MGVIVSNSLFYSQYSPYFKTTMSNFYLDVLNYRDIPSDPQDVSIQIPSQYEHRPDLLSQDAYGDPRLWWVFAVRNPDVIQDPIYDIVAGLTIYIPQKANVMSVIAGN